MEYLQDLGRTYCYYFNDLITIKLFNERDNLDLKVYTFYEEFFKNCVDGDCMSDILSYIQKRSIEFFENFSIDYYDNGDFVTIILALKEDVFDFIAYDYYLAELKNEEKSSIGSKIAEITGDSCYEEYLYFDSNEKTEYGNIMHQDPYYVELDLTRSIKDLIELDKRITNERFMFKLNGLHKHPEPIPAWGRFFFE